MDNQLQFEQAAAMILGFEQHLPKTLRIPMTHINLYHDNVDKIEVATGSDLTHFRIPDSDLLPEVKMESRSRGRDDWGLSRGTGFVNVPTGRKECPRSLFLIRLQGLVNFLQMQFAPKGAKAIGF